MTSTLSPKVTFTRKVDLRSRQAMTDFLAGHFRYSTMSSWNGLSSYANEVKVHHVLPDELVDKAFELIEVQETHDRLADRARDFDRRHNYRWQIGWNGRSGGYLVLYSGERRLSQHKSVCIACGQRNFTSVADTGTRCGRCGSESRVDREMFDIVTNSGTVGTDDRDELAEWTIDELRREVNLVQDFDRACDDVVDEMIYLCLGYEAVEEQVMVPRTVKVLQEVA